MSGAAILSPVLVQQTQKLLGDILFNLYGTSEAGFCIMATAEDLKKYPNTIGRPIRNVQIRIIKSTNSKSIDSLELRCKWSSNENQWVVTGDLAYVNEEGYCFLQGRVDDMIVSGGENVYPLELENCLLMHPKISDVAVIACSDSVFGQCLVAYVVCTDQLDIPTLRDWLSVRVQRHQMPRYIIFIDELPLNSIGKVNKKAMKLLAVNTQMQ